MCENKKPISKRKVLCAILITVLLAVSTVATLYHFSPTRNQSVAQAAVTLPVNVSSSSAEALVNQTVTLTANFTIPTLTETYRSWDFWTTHTRMVPEYSFSSLTFNWSASPSTDTTLYPLGESEINNSVSAVTELIFTEITSSPVTVTLNLCYGNTSIGSGSTVVCPASQPETLALNLTSTQGTNPQLQVNETCTISAVPSFLNQYGNASLPVPTSENLTYNWLITPSSLIDLTINGVANSYDANVSFPLIGNYSSFTIAYPIASSGIVWVYCNVTDQNGAVAFYSMKVADPASFPAEYLGVFGGDYSYLISPDLTGEWYYAINGQTGLVSFTSTNCTAVIDSCLGSNREISFFVGSYTLSGSILVDDLQNVQLNFGGATVNVGSTYIGVYVCGSSNIKISDGVFVGNSSSGLLFKIATYTASNSSVGNVTDVQLENLNCTGTATFGVFVGASNPYYASDVNIQDCVFTYCGWNGITFGSTNVIYCSAKNNEVAFCSDVGITTYGSNNIIEDNYIHDITTNDGAVDSHWGIGIEANGLNTISGNNIFNVGAGIDDNSAAGNNKIYSNTIQQWNLWQDYSAAIYTQSGDQVYLNTLNTTYPDGYGVYIYGSDVTVSGNTISTSYKAIYTTSSATGTSITCNTSPNSGIWNTGIDSIIIANNVYTYSDTGTRTTSSGNTVNGVPLVVAPLPNSGVGAYTYLISSYVNGGATYYQALAEATNQIVSAWTSTNCATTVDDCLANNEIIYFATGNYLLNSNAITLSNIQNVVLNFGMATLTIGDSGLAVLINGGCSNIQLENAVIVGNSTFGMGIKVTANTANVTGVTISNINLSGANEFGVCVIGTSPYYAQNVDVTSSTFTYCGQDGIAFDNANTLYCSAEYNQVTHSSDVGIVTYGNYTDIEDNYIHDITTNDGLTNAHWGIGINSGSYDNVDFNTIFNVVSGVDDDSVGGGNNIISTNIIQQWDVSNEYSAAIYTKSGDQVLYNNLYTTASPHGYGVYVSSCANVVIEGNTISTAYKAINVVSGSTNTFITGNTSPNSGIWDAGTDSIITNNVVLSDSNTGSGTIYHGNTVNGSYVA